ncbi:MAG: acetoacetate decarboxylase [Myxococcota bacterium]
MKKNDILNAASMPIMSPSFPKGPYRFIDREFLIITYETDAAVLKAAVPEPLEPNADNLISFEWINMPDSSGFGSYTESGCVIPCTYKGEACNFVVQMYLDDEAPIAAGREIWGFPKKYAHPKLQIAKDTLTGTLHYAGQPVAIGTMGYKHENLAMEHDKTQELLEKPQVNLKLIPGVDGTPCIAQLVSFKSTEVIVKGCWYGPARLHLIPHVNAPVADFPVKRIVGGKHIIADLTLPYAHVIYDYLKE